jgi:hypothetical protein
MLRQAHEKGEPLSTIIIAIQPAWIPAYAGRTKVSPIPENVLGLLVSGSLSRQSGSH